MPENGKLREHLAPFTILYSIVQREEWLTDDNALLELDDSRDSQAQLSYRWGSRSRELGGEMTDESDHVDRDPSANGQLHIPLTRVLVTQVRPFDVLLGRGRRFQQHEGNQRFQSIIDENKYLYNSFQSRYEKTSTTRDIVNLIKTSSEEIGRFLKFDSAIREWVKVDDEVARVKVGQALRYKPADDADSRVSAQKPRSERQQKARTSKTTTYLSSIGWPVRRK
jgi:hypothetical protein